jgi:hypothetical protein
MSRSYRHSYHWHYVRDSNKLSRSFANRSLRRAVKAAISSMKEIEDIDTLPVLREVSSIYNFATDGLGCFSPSLPNWVLYPDNPRYLPNATTARRIHKFMAK